MSLSNTGRRSSVSRGIQVPSTTAALSHTGPQLSIGKGVLVQATATDLSSQPKSFTKVGALTVMQLAALKIEIAKSLSVNLDYAAINGLGYIGKYLFGATPLISLGYVVAGTTTASLSTNINVWSPNKNGISSVNAYWSATSAQEKIMDENLVYNYNALVLLGAINSNSTNDDIAGKLAVAHILGIDGCNSWIKTGIGVGINGNTGQAFYNAGRYAVNILSTSKLEPVQTTISSTPISSLPEIVYPSIGIWGDKYNIPQITVNELGKIVIAANIPIGNLSGDVTGNLVSTTVRKINGVFLANLSTGILKNTTVTGVPSIAIPVDFPILNQDTTGSAYIVTANAQPAITSVGTLTSLTTSGNVNIGGNLIVSGNTTTINSQTLTVEDINIIIGNVATPSDITAVGGGITLLGATNKTITWNNASNGWELSENIDLASGKSFQISNISVLDSTTIGATVVNSSLTSVGTLGNLTVANTIQTQGIVVPTSTGSGPLSSNLGIKVGTMASSSYGWKDLNGILVPQNPGGPAQGVFRGGAYTGYNFAVSDGLNLSFHLQHDYVVGSDVFMHVHWGHNGTAISGNFVITWAFTVAKGHNQAIFPAEITYVQTISTPNVATIPQYSHRINEFQISAASPAADQFNTNLLEPDSLILLHLTTTTIPTITGGTPNRPYILAIDLHYQSSGVSGTLNKAPSFYS